MGIDPLTIGVRRSPLGLCRLYPTSPLNTLSWVTGTIAETQLTNGFPPPLLYEFCKFFGVQYAIVIPANHVSRHSRAVPNSRRAASPVSAHRARNWSHQLLHLLQGRARGRRHQPELLGHQPCGPRHSLFLPSTAIAAGARIVSRRSRTAYAPTVSTATASWPTPDRVPAFWRC